MAGYKQTIQEHEPLFLITFDGDPYNPATRTLTSIPQEFMDESAYGVNALLHNESETYPAYRMGFASLVELEPTDQRATSFGWYGHQPAAPTRWPKCFVEVPHQSHMTLEDNLGSFTFSFLMNKASDESAWRDVEYALGGAWNSTLIRPLIRKAGVFYMWYQDNWTTADRIYVTHPGGTFSMEVPTSWFYGSNHIFTFTWDVTEPVENQFVAVATLYINGHIYLQQTFNYNFVVPTSTSTAPVEIAGTINPGGASFSDRATSSTMLDQIYLLNKALSHDEVCRLVKKARPYDSTIAFAQPNFYWSMSDDGSPAVKTMIDMMGNRNGTYNGNSSQIIKESAGPPRVAGANGVYFLNGGTAAVHATSSGMYVPVFSDGDNFTVEFWARIENVTRSVLLSIQNDDSPFNGILIQANMRDNVPSPGNIQVSIAQGSYLNNLVLKDNGQAYNFVDSQYHHFCVIRRGLMLELWIDGVKHAQSEFALNSTTYPGPAQIYLMGMMPGNLNTTGYMSCVAIYNYALDPAEVRMRNTFSLIYKIKGTVTLQGNPHQATIRALKHRTGHLEREVLSESDTGDYEIVLYDGSLIDLMALNKQDINIRYRVYGPIYPTAYEDTV